jgi:hypothetical protein
LQAQEDAERSHSTHFEYSIDDYELSAQRIEAELSDLFDEYHWPRLAPQGSEQQAGAEEA